MRFVVLAALVLAACDDRWICDRQVGRTRAYAIDMLANQGFSFDAGSCATWPPPHPPGVTVTRSGDCGSGNTVCQDVALPRSGAAEFSCVLYRRQGEAAYCAADWDDSD